MINVSEYLPPHAHKGPCLRCKMREEQEKRELVCKAKKLEKEQVEAYIAARKVSFELYTGPNYLQRQFNYAKKKICVLGGHVARIAKSCVRLTSRVAFD